MKGALCGLVASTLLMVAGGEAWAQKTRNVVVEQFRGSGADKYREMVTAALQKLPGVDVVSDKKVATTEADLGLLTVSDSYEAVARELKVAAFVSGVVAAAKKKTTLKLAVKDAEGKSLGNQSWSGANAAKAYAAAKAGLPGALKGLLADAKAPSGKAAADAPVARAEKKKDAEEARAEKAAAAPPVAAKVAKEEAPKKKKKQKVEAEEEESAEAEATVAESVDDEAEDEDESAGPTGGMTAAGAPVTGLDLAVGLHAYSRTFTYNENARGTQQEYKLPAAPAANLAVDYWIIPNAALTGEFEYSFSLISQDGNGDKYTTKAYTWGLGAKGRYSLGPADVMATLGYTTQTFDVVPMKDDMSPPDVAGVSYAAVRAGLSTRVGVTSAVAVLAGANYLHLLSEGELTSDAYFPYATGRAGEGFAGVAIALPWMKGLEGRAVVDVRRYVFAMNSQDRDCVDLPKCRLAGGATDQYMGLTLSVAYRP